MILFYKENKRQVFKLRVRMELVWMFGERKKI